MPYIQLKDLDIFYEKMGVGDPIIFLHSGYSRGILAFASQMLDFQRKFTCYFPDFRGHGRTKSQSLEWSTSQLAEDIIGYMDGMQISKAHFIGYSLGATVGLYCSINHPHRVATLTTIGTSGFADPSGADEFEPERLIETGNHEMINQMIERHQDAHQGNWQEFMRQSAKDWRLYPQLTEEQISRISCPSLFISGQHDPFVGEEKVKFLSTLVDRAQYLSVPGGSHRPHMLRESPVYVNDSILEFLNSNSI
ncbi:alpha/beta hydrolase [Paenibacillus psychroresistens]|uniref:Alpha/beta hydrolase n=1 Tax=Paenibacillus psychroresistens TaxID=1778678 RepID=A0A6B8RSB5_9BACL|nr:alpha/beta hydrolase [Paenibacillus psychroresistens]QGQ98226.1 alpha/beta hydrolase [Paenibacillus psychroresistens]